MGWCDDQIQNYIIVLLKFRKITNTHMKSYIEKTPKYDFVIPIKYNFSKPIKNKRGIFTLNR